MFGSPSSTLGDLPPERRDPEGPAGHLRNALQIVANWRDVLESLPPGQFGSSWQPEQNGAPITEALAGALRRAAEAERSYLADTPGAQLSLFPSTVVADAIALARSEASYALKSWRTHAHREQGPSRGFVSGLFTVLARRLNAALREVDSAR